MYNYANSVLKVINNTKRPKEFSLSTPSKISKKKSSAFSLPAGPEFTCPGATEACVDCYAKKGRHVFESVQSAFVRNWKLLQWFEKKNDVEGAAEHIVSQIPSGRKVFRIHESGDFYNQFVIEVWEEVTRRRRDVMFWAYTRSFHLNFQNLVRQPNMRLWASTDSYNEKNAKRFVKRYSKSNVKHAFGPWNHDDSVPENSFVCPATSGKLDVRGACEKCMLCVKKNTKKNVVFLEH